MLCVRKFYQRFPEMPTLIHRGSVETCGLNLALSLNIGINIWTCKIGGSCIGLPDRKVIFLLFCSPIQVRFGGLFFVVVGLFCFGGFFGETTQIRS